MEQNELFDEGKYAQGFNEGYLITKHLPALSDGLSTLQSQASRVMGFLDGRMQYILEQVRERRPAFLKRDADKAPKPDKSKNRDLDLER